MAIFAIFHDKNGYFSKFHLATLVSVLVGKMNRIFGRDRIDTNCRILGLGRVFGRIFGFGLGRYRDFPITN